MNVTNTVKSSFIKYFVTTKDHIKLDSFSLIPKNDNSVLFTNSGMMPFKDIFLGYKQSPYTKVITIQKCLRVGGKHNDLDIIGYSNYHHTFFEMLGIFSFGEYFKEKAILYVWNFLTKILKINKTKLIITVLDTDIITKKIWLSLGIKNNHIILYNKQKNFWTMGIDGPCGPCSEIFYCYSNNINIKNSIEICNLVFMEFNIVNNKIYKLSTNYVDIGMGLERLSSVVQRKSSTYEIEDFKNLIDNISNILQIQDLSHSSLKVLADHIRAVVFLIADGLKPGKEGREYILRKIIRRSILHGFKMNISKQPFFYKIVNILIQTNYPQSEFLLLKQALIEDTILKEEQSFIHNLHRGMKLFNAYVKNTLKNNIISGDVAFTLYDTYGFPLEITKNIAKDLKLSVDENAFKIKMQKQINSSHAYNLKSINNDVSIFVGHQILKCNSQIINLYNNDLLKVNNLTSEGIIVLKNTTFFAESGGQISDKGYIKNKENIIFKVLTVKKINNAILHFGKVISGKFNIYDCVTTHVCKENRCLVSANHTSTHLLHAILLQVLKKSNIEQKGSSINSTRLRFDFNYPSALSDIQIKKIESLVNSIIRKNLEIKILYIPFKEAKILNASYLSKDIYDLNQQVRILKIGDISLELCCGTHVNRTGDIGFFKILSENGIGAGIRRITACTGEIALAYCQNLHNNFIKISQLLKTDNNNVINKLHVLIKSYNKKNYLKIKTCINNINIDLLNTDVHFISYFFDDFCNFTEMKQIIENYKRKYLKIIILFMFNNIENKGQIFISIKNLNFSSKNILNYISQHFPYIKGGGNFSAAKGGSKYKFLRNDFDKLKIKIKNYIYINI